MFAKAASGGCESATTSLAASVRLKKRRSASEPAKSEPALTLEEPPQPTRSVEEAAEGRETARAACNTRAPSRKAERVPSEEDAVGEYVTATCRQVASQAGRAMKKGTTLRMR